jgi:Icc protein
MKRVAWLTDIHLNFLDDAGRRGFFRSVAGQAPGAVLVSGDIAESPDLVQRLREMADAVDCPVYFVLGNHDFYRGSIAQTRKEVTELAAGAESLVYLSVADAVELAPATALVGHDGWADARLGDFYRSDVLLNDFLLIEELKRWDLSTWQLDRPLLEARLHALGDEAADHLARVLPEALESHRMAVVVTHVPPFRQAAWYQGRYSDDAWLPFFACKAVGDVLLEVMRRRPDRELLVLCGHTHGSGQTQVLENLRVLTGGAEYQKPTIQEIFEFD